MPAEVAAPPAAAPPAPVSTPAASTPSTPSAPASTPSSVTPASEAPVTTSTPAGGESLAGKPRPKSADFPGKIADFLRADEAWEQANPEGEKVEAPVTGLTESDLEEPKPAEATTEEPEPAAEAKPAEAVEAPTPEKLAAWMKEDPEFSAWAEKNPAKKGELFAQARELARVEPIAAMFPTVEAAQFANETANRTVAIRGAFLQAAENPETIGAAIDALSNEFLVVDEKGNPVLDAQGNKQYGEDYRMMLEHLGSAMYEGAYSDAKERIASGKLTERQAEHYKTYLEAWDFIKKFNASDDFDLDAPDLENVDPATREWVEKQRADIQRQKDELAGRKTSEKTQAAQQARQQHNVAVTRKVAEEFGGRLDALVKEKKDSGVWIPDYVLQEKNPATGVPIFAQSIYDKFMMETVGWDNTARRFIPDKGIAKIKQDFAKLEALPPSDTAAKSRIEFFAQLREQFLPKLVDAELKRIQGYAKSERTARTNKSEAARDAQITEPRGGGAPRPAMLTEEQAMRQAYAEVDKENAGKYLDPADRTAKAIKRQLQLMGSR